jgi:hypothetical protein
MERFGYLNEPEHIIKAKLRLAELAERLGEVARCREKAYRQVEPLLEQERALVKQITDAASALRELQDAEVPKKED